jgi:hypothetical protein
MTPLRRRMTDDMIHRNRTTKTIKVDTGWIADFAQYFHTSPDGLRPEHVRSYLLHLLQKRQGASGTSGWGQTGYARADLNFPRPA